MTEGRRQWVNLTVVAWTLAAAGGVTIAWRAFVRLQGNSEVGFDLTRLSDVAISDGVVRGVVTLVNRGRQMSAIRRVEGRLVEGPPGRVLVTRRGTRPHDPGFWVANLLDPGESCVAEVEVVLDGPATTPLVVELDVHDIGRRPLVHRRARFTLPVSPVERRPDAPDAGPSA